MSFAFPSATRVRRAARFASFALLGAAALPPAMAGAQTATTLMVVLPTSGGVNFTPTVAGGDPPMQAVVVRTQSATAAPVSGLVVQNVTWEGFGGAAKPGWLTLSFDSTTTPAVLRLRASVAGVPAGSQQRATIDLGAPGATSVRFIAYLDVPHAQPALGIYGNDAQYARFSVLDFPAGADPRTVAAQSASLVLDDLDRADLAGITIGNFKYDIGTPGWLTLSLDTTVTPAVLRMVAKRRVRDSTATQMPLDLGAGNYRVSFDVSAPGMRNAPQNVLVGLTVPSETTLPTGTPNQTISGANQSGGANPTTRFTALAGQRDPAPQLLVVRNQASGSYITGITTGAITYAAGQPTGWLSVEQHGTTQNAALIVRARVAGLAPGSYRATIPVTSDNAAPAVITVNFDVQDPTPVLALSGTSPNVALTLSGPRYGEPPANAPVPVYNLAPAGADRELHGVTLGAPTYSAGATGWLEAVLLDTMARTTILVRPRTSALPIGSYTATLPVSAPGVPASPRTLTVTWVVGSSTGPALAVSKDTVTLASTFDVRSPAQSIAVSNSGGGSIPTLTLDPIEYAAGEPTGWLTATLERASAPSNLTFRATMGDLPGGTYTATVLVRAPEGTWDSPRPVVVRFTVPPRPSLAVQATQVRLDADVQGADPAPRVLAVTNGGGATLDRLTMDTVVYAAGGPTGWLTATLGGATAPTTLTLAPHTGALAAGTYTASVTLRSKATGILDSVKTVELSFVVSQHPTIALSRTTVAFDADTGIAPAPDTLRLTNTGTGTLDGLALGAVQYGDGQPTGWLDATLSGTTAPATLRVAVGTPLTVPGTYTATVPVTASAAGVTNAPQLVTVSYTVQRPAGIVLSATTAAFAAQRFAAAPAEQEIAITNSGDRPLEGLALGGITYADGQPTGWLTATLTQGTEPTRVIVGPSRTDLAPGHYEARVPVTATGVAPREIAVSFDVTPQPVIGLARATAAFQAMAGAESPAPDSIAITNAGGGTLAGLRVESVTQVGGGAAEWLQAALTADTAPATLVLQATTGALAAGTYQADVALASTVAGVETKHVVVTFTVAPRPGIVALSADSVLISAATATAGRMATVTITNAEPNGTLTGLATSISYESGSGWLTATPAATGAPTTLALVGGTSGLAPGVYVATVTVTGTGATPATLRVTLEVVDVVAAGKALVDGASLSAAERARLDRMGNDDGTYNLGDYLAARTRVGIDQ